MERGRTDRPSRNGPRHIGPYQLITRLDPAGPGHPLAPERRFVARSADGARTVLVSAPLDGIDPGRFLVEALAARDAFALPWVLPVTEVSTAADASWYATPYLPLLPLPVALAVHGGPLPEHSVRALGVALADSLAGAHAAGVTHAGVSPAAVLLAWDGPRLTCFGAVRAAAPDGERRSGRPGLEPGSLAPEMAAGGRPKPPGDIYGLGAVLAYAATGHTVPDRSELPDSLRSLVPRCLARDAAARPTAYEVRTVLAPASAAPTPTVLDSPASPMPQGWLPGRVIAALARQSAQLLSAEIPAPHTDTSPRT
ncbi:serine/threonine protein kinase [Streptomyces ficellus]|uniref:Serine/threonine protein kinase n=1 Tax=Streptomyces ficellus TaxID=1977088 RepID=A0A6I6FRU4_9ACTN|nr:serine/threonine protein kinase [Streptomyces ficellus]QGV82535.1 serine/threonine protein kinase [Streptomyces ficellus]